MDVSIDSTEIVAALCRLLHPADTEVIIYHDHPGTSARDPLDQATQPYRFIAKQRERLLAAGFQVSVATGTFTSPSSNIARKIQDLNVDMVAMATHGRTGLSRLMFGSVTESVLHHSTCPMLAISRSPTRDLP